MGRRSVNSTKGGKYMNPTDQARKEARKKELKKNKKQRLMVRQAVLKGKDPAQLLEEMEKIDEMEFNVLQPSPLNDKVLKEKRKKLKETFDRVMRLYHSDNPEVWGDLKRKELDYELRRAKKEQYFESVKTAQSVAIDEIPLPQLPTDDNPSAPTRAPPVLLTNVPVPSFLQQQQQGILKKPIDGQKLPFLDKERDKRDPPGCPPGPPPILALFRDLDDDYVEQEDMGPGGKRLKSSKDDEIISAQKRQAIQAGKNIDELMREVEHDQRRREENKGRAGDRNDSENESKDGSDDEDRDQDESNNDSASDDHSNDSDSDDNPDNHNSMPTRLKSIIPAVNSAPPPAMSSQSLPPLIHSMQPQNNKPHLIVPPPPMGLPPPPPGVGPGPNISHHHHNYPPRPPPPPGLPGHPGMRMNRPGMPPGPPPGGPPQHHHRHGGPGGGMRGMPPGPPPGMPPRMKHHNSNSHHHGHHGGGGGGYHNQGHHYQGSNNHNKPPQDPKSATITAKPQIRNLSADVTRFVPSTLRTKKEEKGPQKPPHMMMPSMMMAQKRQVGGLMGGPQGGVPGGPGGVDANKGKTKDDAYMQFMREMQGLL